ncbi:MAG: hypothetical protein EOP42_03630 [Sphingobacteriaceae bacterium]|nr:MAG: hypothetical protein EOP42_03630 [Sphingobacteriaceae bacterium]
MPKNLNYPLASFQKAFALADAADALGGSCTTEDCATKMQRKISGGFMVIVSSAQKFNLISFEKGIITISDDYKLIKHSYTNSERIGFLQKAFLAPQVFSILFNRFKGKELPVEMLDKILIREFGVEEITAGRVTGYFIDGLKAYGLMNGNKLIEDESNNHEKFDKSVDQIESTVKSETISNTIASDKTDTSFTNQKSENNQYEVQLTGPGISTKLNLEIEEDILILEAIIKKLRKSISIK